MKKIQLSVFLLIALSLSCRKEKVDQFDVSEDQSNWTKIPYTSISATDEEFNSLNINSIFFINNNTGYVAGETCSHENSSRIYKTSDGGNSWSTNYLYGCGAGSRCFSIFFPKPTTGFAIFSCMGYGFTRTIDGGNSWVKDLSVPISDMEAKQYVIDSLREVLLIDFNKCNRIFF